MANTNNNALSLKTDPRYEQTDVSILGQIRTALRSYIVNYDQIIENLATPYDELQAIVDNPQILNAEIMRIMNHNISLLLEPDSNLLKDILKLLLDLRVLNLKAFRYITISQPIDLTNTDFDEVAQTRDGSTPTTIVRIDYFLSDSVNQLFTAIPSIVQGNEDETPHEREKYNIDSLVLDIISRLRQLGSISFGMPVDAKES